uniref:Bm1426 n=1 Tax=Brugia malayi TaxID=6279 RepID=A0A1I9G3N4_BRUMA|nr:Bm1426 [Brugia malayi]
MCSCKSTRFLIKSTTKEYYLFQKKKSPEKHNKGILLVSKL